MGVAASNKASNDRSSWSEAQSASCFHLLNDDAVLHILSYASYAPGERMYNSGDESSVDSVVSGSSTRSKCSGDRESGRSISPPSLNGWRNHGAWRLIENYNRDCLKVEYTRRQQAASRKSFPERRKLRAGRHCSERSFSTLTHVLPLVCRQWFELCRSSDLLWREAITRQLARPVWKGGLESYLSLCCACAPAVADNQSDSKEWFNRRITAAVDAAQKQQSEADRARPPRRRRSSIASVASIANAAVERPRLADVPRSSARQVYREILARHLHIKAKLFYMPCLDQKKSSIELGKTFTLHLHKPQQSVLIDDIMESKLAFVRDEARRFVYAYELPLVAGANACIVEVRWSDMLPNGQVNIAIVPTVHVKLEKILERPNTGRMFVARVRASQCSRPKSNPLLKKRCCTVS